MNKRPDQVEMWVSIRATAEELERLNLEQREALFRGLAQVLGQSAVDESTGARSSAVRAVDS